MIIFFILGGQLKNSIDEQYFLMHILLFHSKRTAYYNEIDP